MQLKALKNEMSVSGARGKNALMLLILANAMLFIRFSLSSDADT